MTHRSRRAGQARARPAPALENDGRGLADHDLHPALGHRLDGRDHPRAVRDLAALDGARPVGIGGDEARSVTGHRLEGDVELGVVERPIERDHHPAHVGIGPGLEAGPPQLGHQRGLTDDEHGRARIEASQVAREHDRGVQHVRGRGGHAQAGQLAGVLRADLQGLVGQEGHAAARRSQRGDDLVGAGDQRVRPGTPCHRGRGATRDGAVRTDTPDARLASRPDCYPPPITRDFPRTALTGTGARRRPGPGPRMARESRRGARRPRRR